VATTSAELPWRASASSVGIRVTLSKPNAKPRPQTRRRYDPFHTNSANGECLMVNLIDPHRHFAATFFTRHVQRVGCNSVGPREDIPAERLRGGRSVGNPQDVYGVAER
jgi:hypothetical protein